VVTTDATEELRRRLQSILQGRYSLERTLGEGGMATVFFARDLRHRRAVAIKLLDPTVTSTIGVERFLREIAITARLQHPHILTLLESGQEGGLVYYVMPHIEGESLRVRLSHEPPLSVTGAVWIAREVADALAHAHGHGVIHRDIKPENILVADGHAWVADFGIARAIETSGEKSLTMAGLPIGTPAYMSPEQAEGRPGVDGRSDTYSLGCVLFEMLTGRPPFVGRSARIVMNHHITTPPPSVGEFRPELPRELVMAVDRAIAKDPNDRFPAVKEFANALDLVAANAVTSSPTPPDAHARAAASGVRRALEDKRELEARRGSKSGALLLAAAALAALALAASTLFPWRKPPGPAPSPPAAPSATADPPASPAPVYRSSIAVMPLVSYSNDSQSTVLSEGLTEEIITQLAQIRNLKVISRTSVVALASKGLTVPQIAETLGVRHVLEGSVQRAGERIRVTLQLIDAETDTHMWAQSYDETLKDAIALRGDVAGKVAAALAITVPGLERTGAGSPSAPENSAAYEAYLRGSYWLGRINLESANRAISAFEDAIRADSGFAPAYAGLSNALQQWVAIARTGDLYATLSRASANVERALQLDPDLAAGYLARATIRLNAWAPDSLVEADISRAMARMPNSAGTRIVHSLALARRGRYADAQVEAAAAVQLDPLSPAMHTAAALNALGARRYDLAMIESRRTLSLDPQFIGGYAIEAVALLEQGQADRCLALDLRAFPELRAMCLLDAGRRSEAAALADSVSTAYAAGKYLSVFQLGLLAAYYGRQGDNGRAVQWLERGYAISPNPIEFRVLDSGLFDRAREDPQFRAALARLHRQVYLRVLR
jgi:serine/threonine-protein kinase